MSKLIVFSVDSLFDEDMAFMRTLPNFGRLMEKAAYSRDGMRSVYPSFTYPAHASMMTGTYPEDHGIFHNEKLDVGNPAPDWFWYYRDLKAETCVDAAKRAGLTTAVVGWPVMGGCPSADWLIPEIWPKEDTIEAHREIFKTAMSENMLKSGIFERHVHKLRRTKQPFMDEFMIGCSCDIIRAFKPDVMFIHGAHLDHTRHANGVHGPAVDMAIIANDDWLGRLMEAAQEAGIYKETNFVVTSDHGHLPVKKLFNPNVLLAESGLIELDESRNIRAWKAYCNTTSLSCQVVMKDPSDGETRARLEKLLYSMRLHREYGVESVFTKEECRREMHLTGEFEYVLEGMECTAFGAAAQGEAVVHPDNSDYKFSVSSHGHMPHKGPQPVFMMAGPDVKAGAVTERRRIIDEAPTFARMLHFTMPQAKGTAMTELLKES